LKSSLSEKRPSYCARRSSIILAQNQTAKRVENDKPNRIAKTAEIPLLYVLS